MKITKVKNLFAASFGLACAVGVTGNASAFTTLDASDGGYYLSLYAPGGTPEAGTFLPGFNPFPGGTFIGFAENATETALAHYRSFYQFDLSGVTETIGSATLKIGLGGPAGSVPGAIFDAYQSNDPFETILISDVTTGLSGTALEIWTDLGDGVTPYSTKNVTAADMETVLEFELSPAAIIALNTARTGSGLWAAGASNTTISGANTPGVQDAEALLSSAWAGANANVGIPQLEITTVPVPAAVWLFGSGMVGLLGLGHRRAALRA